MLTNPRNYRLQGSVKVTKHIHMLDSFLLVCNSNIVFKTRRFSDIRLQKCRDLEIWVKGQSRSLGMSPFDRAHDFLLTFYSNIWLYLVSFLS